MAPCPGLAETNQELERPGVEGKVAGRGFKQARPTCLLSGWCPAELVTGIWE